MARKPESEWSEAYARRMARERAKAAAQGREFNKQRARGKKAGEHVIRKEKEAKRKEFLGVATSQEKAFARQYGRSIHVQLGMEPGEAADKAVEKLQRIGGEQFRAMVKRMKAERAEYKRQLKSHSWISKGAGYLEHLANEFDPDEPDDLFWYYYH